LRFRAIDATIVAVRLIAATIKLHASLIAFGVGWPGLISTLRCRGFAA